MNQSRKLLSCFEITRYDIKGIYNGTEASVDFRAIYITEERDSLELRKRLIEQALEHCRQEFQPKKLTARQLTCNFKGAYPEHLAPESSFKFWKSLPAARARVTIVFPYEGVHQFDGYADIEQRLEDAIDQTEIGFLDGNEVGMGTYEIVLFGPRKAPLLEFVNAWLSTNSISAKSVK